LRHVALTGKACNRVGPPSHRAIYQALIGWLSDRELEAANKIYPVDVDGDFPMPRMTN
jgi:hypothetical protein